MKTLIFASYSGNQQGFTVRNHALEQVAYLDLGFEVNGIAAGTDSDVFLAAANSLSHYKRDGTLIDRMEFPDTAIQYTNVIVVEDTVIASYNGPQKGFTVRNRSLEEIHYVETDFEIKGLAAGVNDDLFLVSSNTLYHYKTTGTFVKKLEAAAGIEYRDITSIGNKVILSHTQLGGPGGFTVMNKDFPMPDQGGFNQGPMPGFNQGPQPGQGGFNQGSQPGQGGFNQGPQPGQGGFNQGPQPGQGGFNQGPMPGQGGFNQGPQSGQGGFNQGPQPGQGGFNQGPMPGQPGGFPQPMIITTNVAINGIVAGVNEDVFCVAGNQIYHYSLAGEELSVKTFDEADISYNSVSTLITY
ncbi:MAG: hypothetical protein ACRBFS_26570 [Aureispira sp.]